MLLYCTFPYYTAYPRKNGFGYKLVNVHFNNPGLYFRYVYHASELGRCDANPVYLIWMRIQIRVFQSGPDSDPDQV